MKPSNRAVQEDDNTSGHEASFSRQVSAIIEKHEKQLLPHEPKREVFASDEAYAERREEYVREYEKCQRELWLMRHHLLDDRPSIDLDNGEELKEMIASKLAVSLPNKAHSSDWWWTPADRSIQGILREVQRSLEKETKSKAQLWRRGMFYAWSVLAELIYLAIVVGVFSAATSKFETVVFSALVMVYNCVAYTASAIYRGVYSLMWRAERTYGEIGRALRLKVPASPAREAETALSESRVAFMIHAASITIGSLIALWHLVAAILP